MNYSNILTFICFLSILNGLILAFAHILDLTKTTTKHKIIFIKAGLAIITISLFIFSIKNMFEINTFKIISKQNIHIDTIFNSEIYYENIITNSNVSFQIFIAYTSIVFFMLFHILLSYLGASKQLSDSTKTTIFEHIIYLNKHINSPLCFGIPKGRIYFPSNTYEKWTKKEIELCFIHEKTHQEQHDPFWKILSLLLRSFLFFAPWSYILHRKLELEMEIFCDLSTCVKANTDTKEYSHFLLTIACNQSYSFIQSNIRNSNLKRRFIAMKSNHISRPFLSTIFSLMLLFSASAAIATTDSTTNMKISYTSGDSYNITIENDYITWKGLTGEDKGIVSKNHTKHIRFSNNIDVFQWTDNKTSVFVTLTLDKKNHQAVCSSLGKDQKQWFLRGKISNS